MNDQGEQIKKNFLQQWIRLAFVALYIIVFGLLWRFIAVLLLVVIILQSLHRVIAAENNSTLLTFSEGLGNFLLKVLHYVLYLSDDKPINFDAFFSQKNEKPEAEEGDLFEPETDTEVADDTPEANVENEAEAAASQSAAEDDVFADISFTEQAEEADEKQDDNKDDDQLKKPD
jgi:hypothetical protein